MLSDGLYQRRNAPSEKILIMGIDAKSLDVLGPIPWTRDIMAMAIDELNYDPDCRPAVIGIDVQYFGETDPYYDDYLVEAAGRYGNVVIACSAEIGPEIVAMENGKFYVNELSVKLFEQPFDALRNVTWQGHINAMLDVDGVLRRNMLFLELPDGTLIPSFPLQVYRKYAAATGLDPDRLPPTTSRHFWYVPFSGMPGDYYAGSVSDLITGEVPDPDIFKDAIVLIGPYASGLQDSFTTPIDRAENMHGVEYMANVIDALIKGDFKTEAPDSLQLAILFLVTFAYILWFLDRKVIPATLVFVAVAGGWLLICLLLYRTGYILHPLWLPLSAAVSYVVTVAVNYIRAASEKRRISATFKRYVAPEIVNELLKEDSESLGLGGKLCDISVIFVDIRGFTPMSEVLEPPQVVEVLNQYLTLTSSCIMSNGGTLDKFIGDATMAFWGAPLPQDDYIFKAAKAALDMVEGSKQLTADLQERFGRAVSFGIGVHCGKAVVGNIGAKMRMDYTAIGDTVNTTARLESNAPPGKIYISRAVADALEGRILTTSLGDTIKLKGKSEGFEILSLDGLAP